MRTSVFATNAVGAPATAPPVAVCMVSAVTAAVDTMVAFCPGNGLGGSLIVSVTLPARSMHRRRKYGWGTEN
jgi:hypothetical protein